MTSTRRLVLIALLAVGLAIGWWWLEGEPQQPDRTDVFDVEDG